MPKTKVKYEVEPDDGLLVCTECGWEKDDVEDDPKAHEDHHRWLREFLAR